MSTIAAVVVTYNRMGMLMKCLDSLRNQTKKVDAIIVVNNGSTDGTDVWLLEQTDLIVIRQENLGGAGGFHRGIKEAYEMKFDWVWIMDDDCIAKGDCLENMFNSLGTQAFHCIAPVVVNREGEIDTGHRGNFKFTNRLESTHVPINPVNKTDIIIDFASFVGLMIHSTAIRQVGLPMKEFFIHNDDVEYCFRLKKIGKILLSVNSEIVHLENATSSTITKSFFSHTRDRLRIDKLWIRYYGVRNLIWLKKHYVFNISVATKAALLFSIVRSLLGQLKDIMLYDDCKFKRLNFYLNAYYDGWRGDFDNVKPKALLLKNNPSTFLKEK
jgi:rhamnopyranosyl-N-acetylglucosaminyl-diphospho-decaprenol beta-1,3/1,4-galactofuranosyltransferase